MVGPVAEAGGSQQSESHRPGALATVLFALYLAGYSGFVLVAAFLTFAGGEATGGLAVRVAGGVPVGVVAGLALIVGAFGLALVYAAFGPRPTVDRHATPSTEPRA
jgi:uncharacterized membrane protein (DUF485 family)